MLSAFRSNSLWIITYIASLFLILYFSLAAASGQMSAVYNGNSSHNHYKLSGKVVNSVTGDPIPHALVQFYSQSALSDSNGQFEFSDLPEMQTNASARKPGFFSEQEIARGPHSAEMIHVGPDSAPVTLKLIPEAVVYGKVESNGEPVERIPISLFQSTIAEGRRTWERHQAFTDDDGAFRIAELHPGNYVLSAGPSIDIAAMAMSGAEVEGYATIFYSGAVEFNQATPINLEAGQQAQIDFSLKKTGTFQLSGTVVGNAPSTNVSLEFKDQSGRSFGFPVRFDERTQQFRARVPAGSYIMYARSQGEDGVALSARLPINITADRAGLSLALEPLPTVPVIVHVESSLSENSRQSGLVRGFSFGHRNGFPMNITLQSTGDSPERINLGADQDRNNDSQLSFHDVEPGKYNVVINAYEPWYVQSATSGGTNLLRQDVEIGGRGQTIDVVLRNDSASLNVTVGPSGQQISGTVLLVRDEAPRQIKTIDVAGGSQFQWDGLAPGGYSLLALDHIENLEYSEPDVLSVYLPRATHVNLQSGQKVDITFEWIQLEK